MINSRTNLNKYHHSHIPPKIERYADPVPTRAIFVNSILGKIFSSSFKAEEIAITRVAIELAENIMIKKNLLYSI